jgi:hypothetical protein
MHRLLRFAALLLLPITTLEAQHTERRFEAWAPAASHAAARGTPLQLASVQIPRRDYRYEGLAFGGIAFGALGAWVGSRITEACPTEPGVDCGPDRLGNAVGVGLMAAAMGGGLGYLVGRLSSKPQPTGARAPSSRLDIALNPSSQQASTHATARDRMPRSSPAPAPPSPPETAPPHADTAPPPAP